MLDKEQNEYVARIHKVQDYIEEHAGESLTTEELAKVAGFSKYHFNRIFKSVLQESLVQYVNRIRLEQSYFEVAYREDKNITDIAYEFGFADSAVFSRAFKKYFGISPATCRKQNRTKCKEEIFISMYNKPDETKNWVEKPFPFTGEVRVETRKEAQAIYVRHTGTYRSLAREYGRLMRQLFQGAMKQGVFEIEKNEILAMYHDNPEISKEEQFRTSLCMTVPDHKPVKEDGKIGVMTIEGGLYAVGHFEIKKEQFEDAWDYMYQKWLMTSSYMPRNASPFEVYLNNPKEEKTGIIKVDIYMPIEPNR